MKIFHSKKVQIILGMLLIIALFVTAYFIIFSKKQPIEQKEDANVVHQLSAEVLGLSLEADADKKAVKFTIANASDITSIEYQILYEADSTDQERLEGGEDRVQRGITGEEKINTSGSYESEWLDLGSCSRNVCRYDNGVTSLTLTLKIIKNDGKIYEAEKSLTL